MSAKSHDVLAEAALFYLRAGDEAGACRCYEAMGAWSEVARVHERAGRYKEAIDHYEKAERWADAARCHRRCRDAHGELRSWLRGGEELRAAWVLANALGWVRRARALAASVSPSSEGERLALAMVLARCEVVQNEHGAAAKKVEDALGTIREIPSSSPWREAPLWALAVTEALRRPDLGARVLRAAAEGGTAFDMTWDAWSLRVFGKVEISPWDFPPQPPWTTAPRAGEERVNPKDGSVQVLVPYGFYRMGAEHISDRLPPGINERSRPVHHVKLSSFWIDKYPVTNARYALYLRANPQVRKPPSRSRFDQPEQPVVGVSWSEAMAYAAWAELALPTEAQWEAAARGKDMRRYPWGNEPPNERLANYGGSLMRTTPVGAYPAGAGPFGALDQAGNVWEWCLDPWKERAYEERDADLLDPVARGSAAEHAARGGSWHDEPESLAAAVRSSPRQSDLLGFRCVGVLLPRTIEP